MPGQEENLYELKNETDKLILGQHFIYGGKNELKIFRKHDFTNEEILKYAEYIKTAIEKNIPNIIAHPDIYMLNRNNFGEAEEQVARIICSTAEKYGIPVEINLSDPVMYIRKQKEKVEYPCKGFWKIASEYKNLKVLYGIDAHWREQIELYEKAVELANEIIGKDIISKLHFCNENLEI